MFTYSLMNLPFILLTIILDLVILQTRVLAKRRTWLVMAVLLALTALADQVLTGLPIVTYNTHHILGIRLGYVPIEDFSYTIVAVIGIGALMTYGSKTPER